MSDYWISNDAAEYVTHSSINNINVTAAYYLSMCQSHIYGHTTNCFTRRSTTSRALLPGSSTGTNHIIERCSMPHSVDLHCARRDLGQPHTHSSPLH
eukprot:3089693-Amphidinium_carterae.3